MNTYTYDAENRIVAVNGRANYIYDASGARVAKLGSGGAVTSVYVLGAGGRQITELNGAGQWLHSDVYTAAGRLLASYTPATSAYHFNLTDWLGTKRMQTYASGNQEQACTSNPFGDGLACSGGADASEQHFTGQDRDAETGLDYFGARYLSSTLGRFMTPDWAAKPASVSYANFGDPQSLNLYAYVGNNPNTGVDLDGHVWDEGSENDANAEWETEMQDDDASNAREESSEVESANGATAPSASSSASGATPTEPSPQMPVDGSAPAGGCPPSCGFTMRINVVNYDAGLAYNYLSSVLNVSSYSPFLQNPTSGQTRASSNAPPQPTWRESFRQTAHYLCGKSASDKVASTVAEGFATGLVEGGVEGLVAGEFFGGEVTFGATGLGGAYLGAHIGGALGGVNGLGLGATYAAVCYAGGMYD